MYHISVLTIHEKACVRAAKFVECDASVVSIIFVGHVKKRQLRQWSRIHDLEAIEANQDPKCEEEHSN